MVNSATVIPSIDTVNVREALGRVLAAGVVAGVDAPPADNSAMDGYAFKYDDAVSSQFSLPVSQRIPAGTAPKPLAPKTIARLFTGSEIPPGADTVAMQEDCIREGDTVIVNSAMTRGENIRHRGQDITCGDTIVSPGTRLRAQEMGLISSVGIKQVDVYRPLKVAILSTGDELVEPGNILQPGQIFNSSRATLTGLLQSLGMEVVDLGEVEDTPQATINALQSASEAADIIISSGGVSVGEEDHVKNAVASLGGIDFWKIAIKPGKPLAFGRIGDTPFIGLPGNPASVFVTFLIIARPYLLASQGQQDRFQHVFKAPALFSKSGERREVYLRCRLAAEGVDLYANQSSGVLSSACWGDVLVRQRPGQDIEKGQLMDVFSYNALLS